MFANADARARPSRPTAAKVSRLAVASSAFKALLATVAVAVTAIAFQGPAGAAVGVVSVDSVTDIGIYNHHAYREVSLRMTGTATGGPYDVPVKLWYPSDTLHHSGVAVVEPVNTVFQAYPFPLPPPAAPAPLYLARLHLGDNELFGHGHVYLGVSWDKSILDATGTGTMGAATDAYAVIRDAAALARGPSVIPTSARPPSSSKVIAYGFSQTAGLLRAFYRDGANSGSGQAFDGALYGGAGGGCTDPALGSFGAYLCGDGPVSDGGKVIAFNGEGDTEWFGYGERGQTADYRLMEIAGTSHIPRAVFPFDAAPAQNPGNWQPVVRASLHNLIAWIDGVAPPDSNFIDLEERVGELAGAPFREAIRDAHGNALGGVRLPHMTAEWHGQEVGAPVGTYEPFDFNQADFLLFIGGHFTPFDTATLDTRYPNHGQYVQRVARAVQRSIERREILREDGETLIQEASRSSIGH